MSRITMTQLYGSSCYKCAFQIYKGYQKYFIHSSSRSCTAEKFRNVPQLRKFERKKLDTSSQSLTLEHASESFKNSKEQMKQFRTNPHPSSSESVLYSLSTAVSYSPHDQRRSRKRNIQSKPAGRGPQVFPELKPFSRTRTTSRNFPEETETVRSLEFQTNQKSSDWVEKSFFESHQTSRNSSVLFSESNFPRRNTGMRGVVGKHLEAPQQSHPSERPECRRVTYDFLEEEDSSEPCEFPKGQSLSGSEASRDTLEEKTRTELGETSSRLTTYDSLREDGIELSDIERSVQGNEPASRNILEEEIDDRIEQSKTNFQSLSPEPMFLSKNAGASNALSTFATVEDVLNYLACNVNIDVKLYASIFETIDALLKRGQSRLSAQQILRCREIENLSKNVRKNLSSLEAEDALVIIKVLTNLGISLNSILVYELLNLLLKSINKLTLKQILFLNRVVTSHSQGVSSSLLDAFAMTVPMVFEMQVRRFVDECDVWTLAHAVVFAVSHKSTSDTTLQILLAELTKRIDGVGSFQAYTIMKILPTANWSRFHLKPLHRKLNGRIEAGLEKLSNRTLVHFLCGSIVKYLRTRDEEFFNVDFFKRVIGLLIREKATLSLKEADMLLYKLNYVNYHCPELLDYIDEQLEKTPALTANEVSCYVHACSINMHKPRRWSSYEERMLAFVDSLTMITQTGFVMDLLVLQCCPEKLVARCLNETFLNQLRSQSLLKDKVILRLQRIHEMVKVFRSFDYSGPFLPDYLVEKAVALQREQRNYGPKNDSLLQGLGGQEYVLNGVRTEFGQVIDHLVVKCKSGEPYAVNPLKISGSCSLSYESLKLPADSYSMAIISMAPSAFCNFGSSRLTGRNQIRLRCLEAKGITPIPIHYGQWLKLSTDERTPYLMDKVDSAFSQHANLRTFDQRA